MFWNFYCYKYCIFPSIFSSSEITKHMAKVMDTSGAFESTNDSSSKINIITQFSNVYSNDWAKLSIWLAKQGISEIQIIQSLTSLMKVL
jgi:hypothetical protein